MKNALRGHFELELGDGTTLPCLLNLYALNLYCEESGATLTELDQSLQKNMLSALPALTWHGVETHCALHGEELPMDRKRYSILFGSSDWAPIADAVGKALNFEPSGQKKATTTRRKVSR